MRIEEISTILKLNADGVYAPLATSGSVSYAPDGHAKCLQVEDGSFWFRHRNECIAHLVAAYPYSGTLLDIGGGNGYVSQRLAADGHDVVLLEPGITGAINARHQRGLDKVVCSTVEDAGFAAGSFGAIGMFDVIEHIEADKEFLATIAPLLTNDGYLYLTVPSHNWLWSETDIRACHFRRHTVKSIEALLDGMFTIEYVSYFFWPLILPQLLLRALPYRLMRGRGHKLLSDRAEHGSDGKLVSRTMLWLLQGETGRIRNRKRIPFGSSCLVAARRIT